MDFRMSCIAFVISFVPCTIGWNLEIVPQIISAPISNRFHHTFHGHSSCFPSLALGRGRAKRYSWSLLSKDENVCMAQNDTRTQDEWHPAAWSVGRWSSLWSDFCQQLTPRCRPVDQDPGHDTLQHQQAGRAAVSGHWLAAVRKNTWHHRQNCSGHCITPTFTLYCIHQWRRCVLRWQAGCYLPPDLSGLQDSSDGLDPAIRADYYRRYDSSPRRDDISPVSQSNRQGHEYPPLLGRNQFGAHGCFVPHQHTPVSKIISWPPRLSGIVASPADRRKHIRKTVAQNQLNCLFVVRDRVLFPRQVFLGSLYRPSYNTESVGNLLSWIMSFSDSPWVNWFSRGHQTCVLDWDLRKRQQIWRWRFQSSLEGISMRPFSYSYLKIGSRREFIIMFISPKTCSSLLTYRLSLPSILTHHQTS